MYVPVLFLHPPASSIRALLMRVLCWTDCEGKKMDRANEKKIKSLFWTFAPALDHAYVLLLLANSSQ